MILSYSLLFDLLMRLPTNAWLGGKTTVPYHYSNEPAHRFKQLAGNITPSSGHAFMHGRRLHRLGCRQMSPHAYLN